MQRHASEPERTDMGTRRTSPDDIPPVLLSGMEAGVVYVFT